MTVQNAVQKADRLRPNAFSAEEKYAWLSEIDGRIKEEIYDLHEGFDDIGSCLYSDQNKTADLYAPEPYSEMYVHWLFMKMDYINGEIDRFNNDAMMHNSTYLAFANHINRTCPPKKKGRISNL